MAAISATAASGPRSFGSTAVPAPTARPSWRRKPMPGAPSGARIGNTQRVVRAAAARPAIENTPSWARPGKPENTSAAKPHSEVQRPSRTVGQLSASQRFAPAPALTPARRSTPTPAPTPAGDTPPASGRAWIR